LIVATLCLLLDLNQLMEVRGLYQMLNRLRILK